MFAALGSGPLDRVVAVQAYLAFATSSALALAAALSERRQAGRQLQEMMDNAAAVVFAKDAEGRYLFVNREFERVVGLPRSLIIGRTLRDLGLERYADMSERLEAAALASGGPIVHEEDVADFGGEQRTWVSVRFPLHGETDDRPTVCGMITDVTDLRRAQQAVRESEERLALVVAATHDGIYDEDVTTGHVWTNPRCRALLGDGDDPARWYCRVDERDRARVNASFAAAVAERRPTWEGEYRVTRPDGSVVHVADRASVHYDPDGRPTRIVGALCDITARKDAEERLRQSNVELEERVRNRTAGLVEANEEMAAFSYSISHDLRAPLRAIDGYGSLIEDEHGRELSPRVADFLHRMREAARRMARLIDDLLVLSRVGRTAIADEEVDLGALAERVVHDLREGEPARTVHVSIAPGLVARGDRGLLGVVMQNLIENAWKFTSKHAEARIEIGRERVGDVEAFFVRDDGAGFDPEHGNRLFRPFERLHRVDEFPGTGIGLATVHRVVTRHGGRVWATGAIERGATVWFTLPARRPDTATRPPPELRPSP
jgi:PAS domain S-box-containing protein